MNTLIFACTNIVQPSRHRRGGSGVLQTDHMGSHGLITYVPGLVGFGVDLRGENNNLRSAAHGWNPTFNEQTVVVFLVSYVCFFCFFLPILICIYLLES